MATTSKLKAKGLEQKVDSLSREVARLRAIVDWEKSLEDVPYDEGKIRPEVMRDIIKQSNRIRAGVEPIYHDDPETFKARIRREKTAPRSRKS